MNKKQISFSLLIITAIINTHCNESEHTFLTAGQHFKEAGAEFIHAVQDVGTGIITTGSHALTEAGKMGSRAAHALTDIEKQTVEKASAALASIKKNVGDTWHACKEKLTLSHSEAALVIKYAVKNTKSAIQKKPHLEVTKDSFVISTDDFQIQGVAEHHTINVTITDKKSGSVERFSLRNTNFEITNVQLDFDEETNHVTIKLPKK